MSYQFNPFSGTFDASVKSAGITSSIQYNSGNGSFGGSSDLTWDDATKELGVGGDINLDDGGTYATTLQLITPTANRTISFPDATGTVALVGGSSGQLIYNNAGAYAGVPSSAIGATGNITLSLAGAASTPPVSLTGTWFSGGTSTTTKPQFLIQPTGTTSTAWSTSGTGLGVNAASGFAGNLLDLQVNGTSKVFFGAVGTSSTSPAIRIQSSSIWAPSSGSFAFGGTSGGAGLMIEGQLGVGLINSGLLWWSNNATAGFYSQRDVALKRDQAGVLSLTDGSTGAGYLKQTPVAVSALPAAATVGAGTRGFVSDSTVAASGNFGATVAGGGSNNVPVFSDGTNWLIG